MLRDEPTEFLEQILVLASHTIEEPESFPTMHQFVNLLLVFVQDPADIRMLTVEMQGQQLEVVDDGAHDVLARLGRIGGLEHDLLDAFLETVQEHSAIVGRLLLFLTIEEFDTHVAIACLIIRVQIGIELPAPFFAWLVLKLLHYTFDSLLPIVLGGKPGRVVLLIEADEGFAGEVGPFLGQGQG